MKLYCYVLDTGTSKLSVYEVEAKETKKTYQSQHDFFPGTYNRRILKSDLNHLNSSFSRLSVISDHPCAEQAADLMLNHRKECVDSLEKDLSKVRGQIYLLENWKNGKIDNWASEQ